VVILQILIYCRGFGATIPGSHAKSSGHASGTCNPSWRQVPCMDCDQTLNEGISLEVSYKNLPNNWLPSRVAVCSADSLPPGGCEAAMYNCALSMRSMLVLVVEWVTRASANVLRPTKALLKALERWGNGQIGQASFPPFGHQTPC
jgi:hypothetical protein